MDKWLENLKRSQETNENLVVVTQQTVSNVISKFVQIKMVQRKPTKQSKRGTRHKQVEEQVVKKSTVKSAKLGQDYRIKFLLPSFFVYVWFVDRQKIIITKYNSCKFFILH